MLTAARARCVTLCQRDREWPPVQDTAVSSARCRGDAEPGKLRVKTRQTPRPRAFVETLAIDGGQRRRTRYSPCVPAGVVQRYRGGSGHSQSPPAGRCGQAYAAQVHGT